MFTLEDAIFSIAVCFISSHFGSIILAQCQRGAAAMGLDGSELAEELKRQEQLYINAIRRRLRLGFAGTGGTLAYR